MMTDNPAERLLKILENGKKIGIEKPNKLAWMQVLEVSGDNLNSHSILLSKLGKVMLLPHDILNLVSLHYPAQISGYQYSFNQIQAAFLNQNLNENWHTFMRHIDSHSLNTLSMISALLDQKLETTTIENEKLNLFREKLKKLINETLKSNLSTDFKKFMTHYLNKILNAINDYLISGAMPVMDAIEATLGHAVLNESFKDELKNTDTGKSISQMLADLANTVAIATAATGTIAYFSTHGFPLLT